jgi:hypothetical protein
MEARMSLRRRSRRAFVLAPALLLVVALWSAVGAKASEPTVTCTQTVSLDAFGPQDGCGGPATHLIFSTQPGDAVVNQLLNPQPVVEAVDDNQVRDPNYDGLITLTIHDNPGGGTLHGTSAVNAVNGVATFTDLYIDQPGTGYTLDADGPQPVVPVVVPATPAGLPTVTSDPFDITQAGPAPASCNSIYAVNDGGTNSRFFEVSETSPYPLVPLGGVHKGANFEGIEIAPNGDIWASTAASNRHNHKGWLYRVDGLTGDLTPAFATGYEDVEGLAFRSSGSLWAWVDGKGLISIDVTAHTTHMEFRSQRHFEALAWNPEGSTLYLGKLNHLWTWNASTHQFTKLPGTLPGNVLGLEYAHFGEFLMGLATQPQIVAWNQGSQSVDTTYATAGYRAIQSLAERFCAQPG